MQLIGSSMFRAACNQRAISEALILLKEAFLGLPKLSFRGRGGSYGPTRGSRSSIWIQAGREKAAVLVPSRAELQQVSGGSRGRERGPPRVPTPGHSFQNMQLCLNSHSKGALEYPECGPGPRQGSQRSSRHDRSPRRPGVPEQSWHGEHTRPNTFKALFSC